MAATVALDGEPSTYGAAELNGASERCNRRAIPSSSLDMGKRLSVRTVAEGVETVEDWRLLAELGCDVAQCRGANRP